MDPRWKHPFTCIVAGPTGSGKTQFVITFVERAEEMMQPPPQKILWFYGEWQEAYLGVQSPTVEFVEGLPNEERLDPTRVNLIIIDDLLAETNSKVTKLFTKGSHHRNTSVIYITQNMFDKNKENRTISLNAHYMVLFKSPRDAAQVEHLARQMFPRNSKFMREAFADATSEPYSYLLVDLKPDTPEDLRLRSKIFPEELQTVYVRR